MNSLVKTKAVILAAGMGNRISALLPQLSKPLLPIRGLDQKGTFLEWHVRALHSVGVQEIVIVGNQFTYQYPLRIPNGIDVKWVLNSTPDLNTSGSGHSSWFAWMSDLQLLDCNSRVILMDADIIYPSALMRFLLSQKSQESKILVSRKAEHNLEEVLVFGKGNQAHWQGKGLFGRNFMSDQECLGEATGIVLWEAGQHALLREVADWMVRFSSAKTKVEHEEITQRMMNLSPLEVVAFGEEFPFMEVDTPDDYYRMIDSVLPRVFALESDAVMKGFFA